MRDLSQERRQYPRIEVDIPIEFRKLSDISVEKFEQLCETVYECNARNITPYGMCMNTDMYISPNTILELQIKFPEETIKAVARVIWSKDIDGMGKFVTGVEYIAIRDNQMNRLSQEVAEYYVEKHQISAEHNKNKLKQILVHLFQHKK